MNPLREDLLDPHNGIVLLIGSGGQQYREYLLASAAERAPIWLIDAAEPTWQKPYIIGSSTVPLLDTARLIPDHDRLLDTAGQVARDHPVHGVLSYDETLVVATAHIAERLGLPGLTPTGVENCRNKHRSRQTLTAAGLPQPRYAYVTGLDDAAEAADRIGYPLVVKPRGMGASIGVVRVDGPGQLAAAFRTADAAGHCGSPAYQGGVLVEEYLPGPEISIDGAVFDGDWTPLFLARKRTGLAPYFEETGHVVDANDPLLQDPELLTTLAAAHRALGVAYGITHTEVRLTPHGPAIVEVNARLGGDLIPYLGRRATGIDPGHVAVDVAGGRRPHIRQDRATTVGIRFAYPPVDGTVTAVTVPGPGTVPGLVEAAPMAAPGTELRLPPHGFLSRYAYAVAEGRDRRTCEAVLDRVVSLSSLTLRPLPEAAPEGSVTL
ncbi:ATP-grasp domain-containing protein [Streptomyces lincolnensis]|uniref:ATP-grasp domain-containing protein n=1 Tax=Streptomyces lincolnensis TaxID=1915 RepID=UPI0037D59B46